MDVYAQGLLVTSNPSFLLGLTNALQLTLGGSIVIPGVTPIPGLAIIQPGTFQMGSNEDGGPYYGQAVEQPVHPVTVSKPF
jgi:formylglycine-generating enzyme required for sulfatase activity